MILADARLREIRDGEIGGGGGDRNTSIIVRLNAMLDTPSRD
jgi:hypothetical protein